MEKECYIRCEVKKGLFSDEAMVRFKTLDSAGQESSASTIVPKSVVIVEPGSPGRGKLKATCVERKGNKVSLILPQPTVENGPCVIVPAQEVTSA